MQNLFKLYCNINFYVDRYYRPTIEDLEVP